MSEQVSKASGDNAYYYAGPVARAYENDFRHKLAFIAGPTGGGKTFASLRKYQKTALVQHPSAIDGIRRAKIGCLGPSYPVLHRTVIQSYKRLYPEGKGSKYEGSNNRQLSHHYKGVHRDFPFELEVEFIAIQDLDYDEIFRGTEFTAFHFPEADTAQAMDAISYAQNRVGRAYLEHVPDGMQLAYQGVYGDSNTPVIGSWFHELFYLGLEDEKSKEISKSRILYKQPAGYDPDAADGWGAGAENRRMLERSSKTYYRDKAEEMAVNGDGEAKVKRLLRCIPTSDMFGQPVHVSFNADVHCTSMLLRPDPGARVVIGVDVGLTPGAVFMQKTLTGQWRAFYEIAPTTGAMDAQELGGRIKYVLEEMFGGAPGGAVIFADPAGNNRSQIDKKLTAIKVVAQASGVPVLPAPSNDPMVRITAGERVLKRAWSDTDGRIQRGMVISRTGCPMLVRALGGGYGYKKRHGEVKPEIDKGKLSHIAEAWQYGLLGAEGVEGLGGRFAVSGSSKIKRPMKVTNSYGQRL